MQLVKAHALIAAACLGLAQGTAAAERVPKPKLRPAPVLAAKTAAVPVPRLRPPAPAVAPPETEAPPRASIASAIPVPRLRPAPERPEPSPAPETQEDAAPGGKGGWPAAAVAAGRAECKVLLDGLVVSYRPVGPIGQQGGCGAAAPVEISAIAGVRLSPPATETCAMAQALAAWVSEDVQPAARKRLGTEVTEIHTATSYACRHRNNGSSGKMSEHGKANALDMSGFSFTKKTDVAVAGHGSWGDGLLGAIGFSRDGSFLDDIRKAACTHFTTVLGPGSDPYHGNHFHVDVLARKGGYRICQ